MNLLIIEDEPRLRHSLTELMPWEKAGITGVTAAATAEEGKRWLQVKRPDILLVDIQLPDGNGLELARQAMAWNAEIKAIILSGHDHFPYAQEALALGVKQYLLKPAGQDAIVRAVAEAVAERRSEIQRKHDYASLRRQWQAHLPALQQRTLRLGLEGGLPAEAFRQRMAELGIALSADERCAVLVMEPDPVSPERAQAFGEDAALIHFAVGQVAEETLRSMGARSALICRDVDKPIAILFRHDPGDGGTADGDAVIAIHAMAGAMLEHIKTSLKLTASAGISSAHGGLENVPRLYKEAMFALGQRLVHGGDLVIPYREGGIAPPPEAAAVQSERWMRELDIAWSTGDERQASVAAEAWIGEVCAIEQAEALKEEMLLLQSWIVTWMYKQGWSLHEVMQEDAESFHHASELRTKQEWSGWMRSVMRRIGAQSCLVRRRGGNRLVAEVKELIERELHGELSLQGVADRLFINASYLSRLFKQEMEQPFSAYVLERRMERAKEALFQGKRVYDAAQAAGFRDVSYFTKVFRKYWGVTPSEWKRG
ncbi:response regulator [Paenibacillus thiaminolyticus]|uniref:helix-turn-helix domain-containing protein n=1 Tax=Paenibacillus thiaminolyticus TaxID=49283 RepID=UPI00232D9D68|nr:helix-turn-helix domain-containing protein [Paenibacillus thiaminolyticus]WCF08695.1 response regulator [Paenibacillus thiaminolyticus]